MSNFNPYINKFLESRNLREVGKYKGITVYENISRIPTKTLQPSFMEMPVLTSVLDYFNLKNKPNVYILGLENEYLYPAYLPESNSPVISNPVVIKLSKSEYKKIIRKFKKTTLKNIGWENMTEQEEAEYEQLLSQNRFGRRHAIVQEHKYDEDVNETLERMKLQTRLFCLQVAAIDDSNLLEKMLKEIRREQDPKQVDEFMMKSQRELCIVNRIRDLEQENLQNMKERTTRLREPSRKIPQLSHIRNRSFNRSKKKLVAL